MLQQVLKLILLPAKSSFILIPSASPCHGTGALMGLGATTATYATGRAQRARERARASESERQSEKKRKAQTLDRSAADLTSHSRTAGSLWVPTTSSLCRCTPQRTELAHGAEIFHRVYFLTFVVCATYLLLAHRSQSSSSRSHPSCPSSP